MCRCVNKALKERNIICLGVNSKGNGQYWLLFQGKDVNNIQKDNTQVKTYFNRGILYREQQYLVRVNRAYYGIVVDKIDYLIFSQLNRVKVYKIQQLRSVLINKEYYLIVIYLDIKEEVNRLIIKIIVTIVNREYIYTYLFIIGQ